MDESEFNAVLGNFDEAAKQNALNAAGYYTTDQVHALNVDAPLLTRDPDTGLFKLTLGVKKSNNLRDYLPLPLTTSNTGFNSQGQIELEFTTPDKAAFFRVESQ